MCRASCLMRTTSWTVITGDSIYGKAVQFADSIGTLAEFGCDVVLELGPQPTLTAMAASCWPGTRPIVRFLAAQRPR